MKLVKTEIPSGSPKSNLIYYQVCSSPSSTVALSTAEGRLTWLVYIIGSAVGGRVSFNSNEVGGRFLEKG